MKHVQRKNLLFLGCILFMVSVSFFWKSIYVSTVLFFIPKQEKADLEYFFYILNIEGFPWVSKGVKPLSTYDDLPNITFILDDKNCNIFAKYEELLRYLHPIYQRIQKGYKLWETYSQFFPKGKLQIIKGKSPFFRSYDTIMMVNRKALKRAIHQNSEVFSTILGNSFNENTLMENLIQHPGAYKEILKGSHYLMGILYGFGLGNAKAFQQRGEPYAFLPPPYHKVYSNSLNEPVKLTYFLENKEPYDSNNPWFYIPGFMVVSGTDETQSLEKQYLHFFEVIKKEKRCTSELRWSLMQFF